MSLFSVVTFLQGFGMNPKAATMQLIIGLMMLKKQNGK